MQLESRVGGWWAGGQQSRKGRKGPDQEALPCRVKILDFLSTAHSLVPSIAFKVGFQSMLANRGTLGLKAGHPLKDLRQWRDSR